MVQVENLISEQDYQLAKEVVRKYCNASVSHLQRQLHWGYNRAAYAIDRMEKEFIVGPMTASGRREVLDLSIHELWQKAQMVPEGFVLVSKELPESIAEAMALERVSKPFGETDPVWVEITEKVYKEHLVSKKWELWRDYKAMIEAQEPAND